MSEPVITPAAPAAGDEAARSVNEKTPEQLWDEFVAESADDAPDPVRGEDESAADDPAAKTPAAEEAATDDAKTEPAEPAPGRDDEPGEEQATQVGEEPKNEDEDWKAKFAALEKERDAALHRLRSDDGRVAAAQRKIDDLAKQNKALLEKLNGPEPSPEERDKAIGRARDDYPDLAEPLLREIRDIHKRAEAAELSAAEANQAIAEVRARPVENAHPGWFEWIQKPDIGSKYWTWLDDQPRRIREIHDRNSEGITDPDGAIEVLNSFKSSLNPPAAEAAPENPKAPPNDDARARRQRAGAEAPRSTTTNVATARGMPPPNAPAEEQWKYFTSEAASNRG